VDLGPQALVGRAPEAALDLGQGVQVHEHAGQTPVLAEDRGDLLVLVPESRDRHRPPILNLGRSGFKRRPAPARAAGGAYVTNPRRMRKIPKLVRGSPRSGSQDHGSADPGSDRAARRGRPSNAPTSWPASWRRRPRA